jgi:hypothetical protein
MPDAHNANDNSVTRDEMTGSSSVDWIYQQLGYTHSLNYTLIHRQYSAIADLQTLQFTVARALGFSVSTSRLLATDLHKETVTSVTTSITSKIFQLHFQYRCTVAHINTSIHTLHLHRQTSCIILFGASGLHLETSKTELLVKVKVTLRLTVSQSVSLGVEPHLGLMTRYLVLFNSYGLVFFFCGAPSLTRGRVCLFSKTLFIM